MKPDWSLAESTPPAWQPVALDRAKEHLRVTHDTEDDLIAQYLAAATREVEDYTWRSIVLRDWVLTMSTWPDAVRLPRPPFAAVTSVEIVAADGQTITVPPGTYAVAMGDPATLYIRAGKTLPGHEPAPVGAYRITYAAGYATAGAVPLPMVQAILLTLGHFYENREAVIVGSGLTAATLPMAVARICERWRRY